MNCDEFSSFKTERNAFLIRTIIFKKEAKIVKQGIRLKENSHSKKDYTKTHTHSFHQILYVLEDACEIIFEREKYSFSKDTLAFIPPGQKHTTISDSEVTVLECDFDIESVDTTFENILLESNFNQAYLIHLNPFETANVRQLIRRMLYEQSQRTTIARLSVKNYLEELLLLLLKREEKAVTTDANELRAELLKKYIDENYFAINDADDFSKRLDISTRHVNTIFKDQYDTTPMKYLNQVRIKTAQNLLIETEQEISSICFEVGYESLSTFYRRFKEFAKLSPKDYRIKYKYTELI